MFQAMKRNIVEKTGKAFDDWLEITKNAGLDKFKPLLDYMKREHGVSHGYAQMIAWGLLDPDRLDAGHDDESMVDDLYRGKKEAIRPIFHRRIRVWDRDASYRQCSGETGDDTEAEREEAASGHTYDQRSGSPDGM